MKKVLMFLGFLALLAGCKKDSVDKKEPQPDDNSLSLSAQIAASSRTEHSETTAGFSVNWKSGDKIGLFIDTDDAEYVSNLPYKADNAAASSTFSAVGTAAEWKDAVSMHSFYAYYPYDEQTGSDKTAISLSVPAVQTQNGSADTEHLSSLDFLYATRTSSHTVDGSIALTFEHPLSMFALTMVAPSASRTFESVIMRCTDPDEALSAEGAKIDITTGKIDYSDAVCTSQIELQFTNPVTVGPGSDVVAYMQITPGHAGKTFEIIGVSDGVEHLLDTRTMPESGIPSGVRYTLALLVSELPDEVVDLSAAGTANTYIVNAGATEYKFKATVKGNGKALNLSWNSGDGQNITINKSYTEADLAIAPVEAKLVWYNTPKSTVGWVKESPVELSSVSLEDGYVHFKTPLAFVNGNALIAVYDDAGEILWSWNIWAVAGYDPDATAKSVGNYVMMDRNLGAMAGVESKDETDPVKAAWAIGNYYQWGRKDPLPAAAEFGTGNSAMDGDMSWGLPTYTPIDELKKDCSQYEWGADNMIYSNVPAENSLGLKTALGDGFTIEQAVEQSVKYPYKWVSNGTAQSCTSPYMWMNSQSSMTKEQQLSWRYLWGNMNVMDGVKTIYDPCPAGWMVPDAAAVGMALSRAMLSSNGYGTYTDDYGLYFPFGGQRASITSNICDMGTNGGGTLFLATSTVNTLSNPTRGTRSVTAGSDINNGDRYACAAVTTGNSYAGAAVQLRCVKEEKCGTGIQKSPNGPKAGFLGNSITEVWEGRTNNPNFFKDNDYFHNGHSGTVTSNFIERSNYMHVKKARVLVVCGGINDISENTGFYIPLEDIYNNLRLIAACGAMANMKVIIGSTVPANYIWWQNETWNAAHTDVADRVIELNRRLKALCEQEGYTYCDYHSSLKDEENGLALQYSWSSSDRVHPNGAGYAVMESIVKPLIDEALNEPDVIKGGSEAKDLDKVEL